MCYECFLQSNHWKFPEVKQLSLTFAEAHVSPMLHSDCSTCIREFLFLTGTFNSSTGENQHTFLAISPHVQVELGRKQEVVVYDQNSKEAGHLSKDGFVHILMGKLEGTFHKVSLLTGNLTQCRVQMWRMCCCLFLFSSLYYFIFLFSTCICTLERCALSPIFYLYAPLSFHSLVSRCQWLAQMHKFPRRVKQVIPHF